jgi:hypothetical protein
MQTTALPELTLEVDSYITRSYDVAVIGGGLLQAPVGTRFPLSFTVVNRGINDDTYTLVTESNVTWGDFTAVPSSLTIKAGARTQVGIVITIPASIPVGTEGHFSLQATSQEAPRMLDIAEASVTTTPAQSPLPGDLNGDGVVDCSDLAIVRTSFGKQSGQQGFDPRADTNSDGIVNVKDLSFVAQKLPAGTRCP